MELTIKASTVTPAKIPSPMGSTDNVLPGMTKAATCDEVACD